MQKADTWRAGWRALRFAILALSTLGGGAHAFAAPSAFAARPPEDEVIYFALPDRFANGDPANDRGGASGDRSVTGYDPTDPGFYQGGDLKGLTEHLGYIQHLGATALWVAPVFRNRWVQGPPGHQSAAYHGYWITDFTDVDPHFGTRADFKRLVDSAHARGIKVILDIVINHTADVIQYRECPRGKPCPYRSEADYPFTRRGGLKGAMINTGFKGDAAGQQTTENFAKLVSPDYAYTPYIPAGEEHMKQPEWLNDVRLYHNRGEMGNFTGVEDRTHGDFGGLDDVMTENPRVVAGFIQVYESWIADFGIDGYRIDTARHVNPEFWQAFSPAILKFAREHGRPNFHIFGEIYDPDPAIEASHTRVDKLPAVLDFGFQAAALDALSGKTGPKRLADLFAADPDYEGGVAGAMRLPTFLDNHDMGRIGFLLQKRLPGVSREALAARIRLGHALLLFSRGVPVIYYGDEQGLIGLGDDRMSRETLFASAAPAFQAERPLGAERPGAPGLNEDAPMYRAIAAMARLRDAHPGLRRGVQEVRRADAKPGLYVFTRTDPADGQYLVALNFAEQPLEAQVSVGADHARWTTLAGACAPAVSAPGSLHVAVPALGWIVCRSETGG